LSGDRAIPEILSFLKTLYWILTDLLEALKDFKASVEHSIKNHVMDVESRLIQTRLKLNQILQTLNVQFTEKPESIELYGDAGLIAHEAVEKFKECLGVFKVNPNPPLTMIARYMKTFVEASDLAAKILKAYQGVLEEHDAPGYRSLAISLKSIAREFEELKSIGPKT
jgi:hypothetical protein